eukprot:UN03244
MAITITTDFKPSQRLTPLIFMQRLPFCRFSSYFYLLLGLGKKLVNTDLLTKR